MNSYAERTGAILGGRNDWDQIPDPSAALHIAPVLLGDGLRLYDNPGGAPIHLHRLDTADPHSEVDVRYRPVR